MTAAEPATPIHRFAGTRALVTGTGGGIGEAIARRLVAAGCDVIGFDVKPARPDGPEGPGRFRHVVGDLCAEADVAAAFDLLGAEPLDFLVNAAGVAMMDRDGSAVEIDMAVWQRTLEINLNGALRTTRLAVPRMLAAGRGSMVHIASVVGLRSMDNAMETGPLDAYHVSKAGLIALSRSLALSYGRQGLRSNTICPGAVWTPMTDHIYRQSDRIARMSARTPLGRLGMPDDIAAACLFLLSEDAAFITGIDLVVDGGLMAKLG